MSCPGLRRTATRSPTAGKSFSSPSDAPLANETACSARKSRPGVATSGNPRSSRTTHPACICSGYSAAATSASKAERCAASNGSSSKAGTSRSASTAGNASTATFASAFPLRPRAPRAKAPFFLPLPLATKTSRAAKLPSFYREMPDAGQQTSQSKSPVAIPREGRPKAPKGFPSRTIRSAEPLLPKPEGRGIKQIPQQRSP